MMGLCAILLSACGLPSVFSNQREGRAEVFAPPSGGAREMSAFKPMDLRADQLFSEELKNVDARIGRIETVVAAMKEEFDVLIDLKPTIQRLAAIEGDFQTLVNSLENLLQNTATMPVPQTAAVDIPAPVTSPPAASDNDQGLVNGQGLRFGEHPQFTRIVVDVSEATPYRIDLDNEERILMIELSEAFWTGPQESAPVKFPAIRSWSVHSIDDGGVGTRIVVQLSQPVTLINQGTLTNPDRIMIDFSSRS